MKAFLAAQALVQIIGLAFLHQDPTAGVQVVFPRIEEGSKTHVEGHTAIIAFQTKDRLHESGWKSQQLKPAAGWSWVPMNGEKISLVAHGTNKRAVVPPALPHLAPKNCPGMAVLRKGYQPPSWSSAAAVVTFPVGTMNVCRAKAKNVEGRIDTKITLTTSGGFKVQALGRSLTFRDNARVIFANVPTAWLQSLPAASGLTGPHSSAYFALGENMRAPCSLPRVQTKLDDCEPTPMIPPGGTVPVDPNAPDTIFRMMSYECSNTQWP